MGSTSNPSLSRSSFSSRRRERSRLTTRSANGFRNMPAWKDVNIRRLLNMTSGIPTYSETEWMSRAWADEPMRAFTLKELVGVAYPSATNKLPVRRVFYSNTNYILAGMIAEKATGKSYRDLVHELVIEPHGLYSTFYEAASTRNRSSSVSRTATSRTRRAPITSRRTAKNRGICRSSDGICGRSASPGHKPPAAPSPAHATSIAGCVQSSTGRWYRRSSRRSGCSSSRRSPASRSPPYLPMTRPASPSGCQPHPWAFGRPVVLPRRDPRLSDALRLDRRRGLDDHGSDQQSAARRHRQAQRRRRRPLRDRQEVEGRLVPH